jgi:hypothetical protein
MPYYFSWFMAQLLTDQSISIHQTEVGIISPVTFANEASHIQYKLWENHDLTVLPVITYIYLCGRIYASCFSYFSNRPSGIEHKLNLNVTQAFRENIPLAFYHTQKVGA